MNRFLRTVLVAGMMPAALAVSLGTAAAQTAEGRMLRPKLIIHVVANLEKSIAFYREGLDLEVASGPAPYTASALVHKAVATSPAAKARQATLIVPGSNLQLQLIEFSASRASPSSSVCTTQG